MNILIYARENARESMKLSSEHLKSIKSAAPDAQIVVTDTPTSKQLQETEVMLPVLPLENLPLEQMTQLKWVHVTSAGVNKLPDEIKNSDVQITNSSGVHPIPISEHVFAYLLMFARSMHLTYKAQIFEKKWLGKKSQINTFEIHGKKIGIVGLGRIGSEIAHVAKGFDMKVIGVVSNKKRAVENVDMLLELNDLDILLSQSDFVINCLPATQDTRALFTLEKFKKMNSGAYFVNIGRGACVVETDLITALRENVIAGAGLDVFEKEPLSEDSPLWSLPNVIITPHSAGKTPHYIDRVIKIFSENLSGYINNNNMPNLFDKGKGY